MCGLPPTCAISQVGFGKFVDRLLLVIDGCRLPAGPIGRACEECALSLHACQTGERRRQSGSFHHVGHFRRSLCNPVSYPFVPLGKCARVAGARPIDRLALAQGYRLALGEYFPR